MKRHPSNYRPVSVRAGQLATVSLVTFLAFTAGCARNASVVGKTAYFSVVRTQPPAGVSPADEVHVKKHCVFGKPRLDPKWNYGPVDLVAHDGYVLLHSATEKIPLWVCEYVVKNQLTGTLTRRDNFRPDPLLKPGRRAELTDYKKSGYNRGHQAPAGDQTKDEKLKDETFCLSNMAPQLPALNQQVWSQLEAAIRNWLTERGDGYVITGPMFYDPKEEDAHTATGVIAHKVIGPDGVAVPTHFYKIVVAKDARGQWESIAFVLENRKYPKPYDFAKYIRSIDWIQQRTGIDFMPELDVLEQKRLEQNATRLWN